MQTFLPYASYESTSKCLDYKRLGNQRIEARAIYYLCHRLNGTDLREDLAITNSNAGFLWNRYRNHPAVRMWRGYEYSLALYHDTVVCEWINRGYKNSMEYIITNDFATRVAVSNPPWWLGDGVFHSTHRSNLLRKLPEHYSQFRWEETNNIEYYWPVERR